MAGNDIHQHLVCANDVNILSRSICTTKKNTEALVGASRETRLEVNADKTEYSNVSRSECRTKS
jgi:hypothetical protein